MRTKTRLTALLISVLMIFAMLPLAVFAADGDVAEVTINGTTTGYASIGAAWVAAQKSTTQNATVKLLADCQLDNYYRQTDYIITLDLNGHVLKAAEGKQHFGVWVDATLTITDSNPTAEHWYTKDATTGLYTLVEEGTEGAFMIPGGVITGGVAPSGKNGGAILVEGGTLYVEGGNFIGNQAPYGGAIFGGLANRAYQYDRNLKEIEASTGVKWETGVYGCQVYISGGTFVGNVASDSQIRLVNMEKKYTIPNNVIDETAKKIMVNVADAELIGGVYGDNLAGSDTKNWRPDNSEIVKNEVTGYWELKLLPVAEVIKPNGRTMQFYTLKEAWDKAEELDNCTVRLLRNCYAEHDTFVRTPGATPAVFENRGMILGFDKTLTLDLNGFVLTPPTEKVDGSDATGISRVIWVHRFATLIVKDSNPDAANYYSVDETTGLYTYAPDVTEDTEGYVKLTGGAITGGNATGGNSIHGGGGAIFVQGGRLIVEGGNFVGNTGSDGGAINVGLGDLNDLPEELHPTSGKTMIAPAVEIKGGTFVGNVSNTANCNIIGGQYLNTLDARMDIWSKSVITGGTFSDAMTGLKNQPITALIAPGYVFEENAETGMWEVKDSGAVPVEKDGVTHYMLESEAAVAPTCENVGKTAVRTCMIKHNGEACTFTDGGEEIEKLAHTPGEWTVETAATATAAGSEIKSCTVCEAQLEERAIPALGTPNTDNNNNNDNSEETEEVTEAPTTKAPATTEAPAANAEGCASIVGGGIGMALIALLGGCMLCRKKED